MENSYLIYELANFVYNLRYEDLNDRAVEVSKQVILDSYGNMIFGRFSEKKDEILAFYHLSRNPSADKPRYKLLGVEEQSDLDTAVFAHTMMARIADLDDGYSHAMGHPGSGLIPLLLTLNQHLQKSGREMITAVAAGYEIYARLGEALNPPMYRERGFDATGVCGAIASAALIGKLEGAREEEIRNAMGIASLFTGGLIEYQNDGTSGKIMCSGWGALTGLRAFRLAKAGFDGPKAALEGRYGFFQAFKGTSGYCDMSNVLTKLGEDFKVTLIYFKRYACQRALHAILDAMIEIRNQHDIEIQDIKSVDIRTSSFITRLANDSPSTAVGAQASTQFTSAVALKHGRMDSEKLVFSSFKDLEIKELVKKIHVIKDEEVQDYLAKNPTHFCAALIQIQMNNGSVYEKWSPYPLGDVQSPFGWDVLNEKYLHLLEETPIADLGKEKIEFISNLEKQANSNELFILVK